MAGRQYRNMLVAGASGSGKSHWVDNQLLPEMLPRCRYTVIINTTEELSHHCNHHEYVGEDKQLVAYDPAKLAELIRHHGRVHFEVAPGKNCPAFLETLGEALWMLGIYKTEYTEVLVVLDESHLYLSKKAMPSSFARLETEGRKFGFDLLKITQTLQSATGETISALALKQVNVYVVFNMNDFNDIKRITALFPGIQPDSFGRPESGPPEYGVRDAARGKTLIVKRDGHGGRVGIAA